MIRALLSCLVLASSGGAMAFANLGIGDPVANSELRQLGGEPQQLLRDTAATVFVFFDPGQEHSRTTLGHLAALRTELGDRDVDWVGIASDRFPEDAVREALAASGLALRALLDEGDALYGELGVRLYPSIGIVDADHRLRSYLPYTQINYIDLVRGHLQRALGEITDDELAAIERPEELDLQANGAKASRNLKMATMLLGAGKIDQALESARAAVALEPDLAEAHAVLANVLSAHGDCDEAAASLQRALELDPDDPTANGPRPPCG